MTEGGYSKCKILSLLFRIATLTLSVAALVVMTTASQQVLVDRGGAGSSSYSAVSNVPRYFVAATAISVFCSAAALFVFATCAAATAVSLSLVPLFDCVVQGFLFSAAGASLVARDVLKGSSACDAPGVFCRRVTTAADLCALAAVFAVVAALARDAANGCSEE